MQTEVLIRRLVAEAGPVTRLRPVSFRVLAWLVPAALSLGVVLALMGVQRELGDDVALIDFTAQEILLIVTALSAAVGALIVAVPGAERSSLVRWGPVVAVLASTAWAVGELAYAAAVGLPIGRLAFAWQCVAKTTTIAVVPAVVLVLQVRRAAPLRAAWAGLLVALAATAVGVVGTNLACPSDRPLHLLLWHVAPLLAYAALGALLGTWWLRQGGRARDV